MPSRRRLRLARFEWAFVALLSVSVSACGLPNGHGVIPPPTGGGTSVRIATVPGLGRILVNRQGLTLYYSVAGGHGLVVCSFGCLDWWAPLVAPAGGPPTGGPGVTGDLGVAIQPFTHDRQVTYDGYALYTSANDMRPGQTNGEGFAGVWFAATPTGMGWVQIGRDRAHNMGLQPVSGSTVRVGLNDFSFTPTGIWGPPGRPVTLSLVNLSPRTHSFTLPAQHIDVDVGPGDTVAVRVTIPKKGGQEFYSRADRSQGMVGALMVSGATFADVRPAPA